MIWSRKQVEIREQEKRRVASMMTPAHKKKLPPPTQAEVDASVAAFLARGGEVKVAAPTAPPVQLIGNERALALSRTD